MIIVTLCMKIISSLWRIRLVTNKIPNDIEKEEMDGTKYCQVMAPTRILYRPHPHLSVFPPSDLPTPCDSFCKVPLLRTVWKIPGQEDLPGEAFRKGGAIERERIGRLQSCSLCVCVYCDHGLYRVDVAPNVFVSAEPRRIYLLCCYSPPPP